MPPNSKWSAGMSNARLHDHVRSDIVGIGRDAPRARRVAVADVPGRVVQAAILANAGEEVLDPGWCRSQ